MPSKKKGTGGIGDISDSGLGSLSKALSGVMNSGTLRGLAKKRVGDKAPAASTKRSVKTEDSASGMYSSELQNRTAPAPKPVVKKGMGGHRGR